MMDMAYDKTNGRVLQSLLFSGHLNSIADHLKEPFG